MRESCNGTRHVGNNHVYFEAPVISEVSMKFIFLIREPVLKFFPHGRNNSTYLVHLRAHFAPARATGSCIIDAKVTI